MTAEQRKPKRSSGSLSSERTAQLKTTTEVLAFGGALVEQFKLRADEDTLGQWMAHYLAEKLTAHKRAVGAAKAVLEADIVDLVLKFWKHRAYFPRGTRPFEEYESVLRALESLDPDQSNGRYFQYRFFEEDKASKKGPSAAWIDAAKSFDRGARAIVSFCIRQAAHAAGKQDDDWLKAAKVLAEDADRALIVIKIVTEGTKEEDEKIDPTKYAVDRLTKTREDLVKLMRGGSVVLRTLNEGLDELVTKTSTSSKVAPKAKARTSGKAAAKKRTENEKQSRKQPGKKVAKTNAPSPKKASR
jgi:hypothetical protein